MIPRPYSNVTERTDPQPPSNASVGPVTPLQSIHIPSPPQERKKAPVTVERPHKDNVGGLELTSILDKTLHPHHRNDSNILKFIAKYLECRNVAQVADSIGLPRPIASKIKNMNDVTLAIQAITDRAVLKHGYDATDVIERVKEVVNVDPAEMVMSDGSFIENLRDIPPEIRRGIKKFKAKNLYDYDVNGIKTVVGKVIEVEFWDKLKAAEMLGSEVGVFKKTQKVEIDIGKNMSSILLESKRRAEEHVQNIIDVTQTYPNVTNEQESMV